MIFIFTEELNLPSLVGSPLSTTFFFYLQGSNPRHLLKRSEPSFTRTNEMLAFSICLLFPYQIKYRLRFFIRIKKLINELMDRTILLLIIF